MQRLARFANLTLIRYLAASVGALAVDFGSFLAFLSLGIAAVPASAAGYVLGIAAHWLLSSRAVFTQSVAARGPERTRQKAMFAGSALVGLGLTTGIVAGAASLGIDPRLAKLAAIVVSFAATWLLREKIVFRAARA